jgi:hypothetical protein
LWTKTAAAGGVVLEEEEAKREIEPAALGLQKTDRIYICERTTYMLVMVVEILICKQGSSICL